MTKFYFKGLMCPTFTAFSKDRKQVDYDIIDGYCKYLKTNGIHGVLVNGTSGEGSCLSIDKRKRLAEEWLKACRKYGVVMMLQIGGCYMEGVFELAKHSEKIGVDCVLCLPELFFKPNTERDLIEYIKNVSIHCPTRPFYYYHIPRMSGINLNMIHFYDIIERELPMFCGIKYTNGDMEIAVQLLKEGRNILLGSDTILLGALSLGFDAAILTSLNICPNMVSEIYDHWENGCGREGLLAQKKLNSRIKEILSIGTGEWVENMKIEFNKVCPNLYVGPVRKPTVTHRQA